MLQKALATMSLENNSKIGSFLEEGKLVIKPENWVYISSDIKEEILDMVEQNQRPMFSNGYTFAS